MKIEPTDARYIAMMHAVRVHLAASAWGKCEVSDVIANYHALYAALTSPTPAAPTASDEPDDLQLA